ncbi:MAG: MTH1187 family thiamine-binding protein [Myxococcota bacterium]
MIAAVSISPLGVGISVSAYVAAAIAVLEAQDEVRWELDSMFTTLEGERGAVFSLIEAMQEAVFAAGAERVGTVIKTDERRDRPDVRMKDKVEAVEAHLATRRGEEG